MVNKELLEEFKRMPLSEIKVYLDASEQESFPEDSKVRQILKKYTRFGEDSVHYPIPFALTEMYIALSHALYYRLDDSTTDMKKAINTLFENEENEK